MKTTPALMLLAVICGVSCSSCSTTRAFFYHPMQAGNLPYQTMPVATDRQKSATYVDGSFSVGSMNDDMRDAIYGFQGGIHRANVIGPLRLNYGASATVGSYHVGEYYYYQPNGTYQGTRVYSGSNFFGAVGLSGGLSLATPMGRGEWRYLGVETSLYNDFGDYYGFRSKIPDSLVTQVDRSRTLGSIGGTTELVFKGRSGKKFGIRFSAGSYLRKLTPAYTPASNGFNYFSGGNSLFYISNAYHFTINRTTTAFQFSFGQHTARFQFGINYRL